MGATSLPRTVGRYRGFDIRGGPLRDVMPLAEANPYLWFAFGPDGDLVVAGVPTRRQLEAAIDDMVGPSPVAFRSVDRPELVLDGDDVFVCDCVEYGWDPDRCPDCRGHRLLHGYATGGIGLPVVVEGALRGVATPDSHEGASPEAREHRGTRSPQSVA